MDLKVLVILILSIANVYEAQLGDRCTKAGSPGVCVNIRSCQSAIDEIRKRKPPQICGFSGNDPIVCCPDSNPGPAPVATTTTRRPSSTTTEYVPPVYDYQDTSAMAPTRTDGCSALSASLTAPKTGQRAWDKCIDYQEQLVYPCVKGQALSGEKGRSDRCGHGADELIVGGVDAARNEFPHMALLGYGDNIGSLQWLCGGTLISDQWVLTAAHCTNTREYGDVTYIALGKLRRSDSVDSSKVHRIQRIVKHPNYKSPVKYNDIALLQTANTVKLDQFTVPACLHAGETVKDESAIASGWGAVEYRGPNADNLQKVILTKFKTAECQAQFPVNRNMPKGVDTATQICYGDYTKSKDTCQGDSGGPLVIKNKRIYCMYTVVAVTSFGKACGFVAEPGIYTRVQPYIKWIESLVWP